MIEALFMGWFLTLFGAHTLVLQGLLELTGNQYSVAVYYLIWFMVGILSMWVNSRQVR